MMNESELRNLPFLTFISLVIQKAGEQDKSSLYIFVTLYLYYHKKIFWFLVFLSVLLLCLLADLGINILGGSFLKNPKEIYVSSSNWAHFPAEYIAGGITPEKVLPIKKGVISQTIQRFTDRVTLQVDTTELDKMITHYQEMTQSWKEPDEFKRSRNAEILKTTRELKTTIIKEFKRTYEITGTAGKKGALRNEQVIIPHNFQEVKGLLLYNQMLKEFFTSLDEPFGSVNEIVYYGLQTSCYFLVRSPGGKYGLYYNSRQVLPPVYDSIEFSGDFYFTVTRENRQGVFAFDRIQLETDYQSLFYLGNNLFFVENDDSGQIVKLDFSLSEDKDIFQLEDDNDLMKHIKKTVYTHRIPSGCELFFYRDFENFLLLKQGNRYGLGNIKKQHFTQLIFDRIDFFKSGFFQVVQNGKTGILSTELTPILKPEYDSLSYYDKQTIRMKKGDKYGLANWKYEIILPPDCDEIKKLDSSPLYVARKQNAYGLVLENNTIFPPVYDLVELYLLDNDYGDFFIRADDSYGYIKRMKYHDYRLFSGPTSFFYEISRDFFLFFPDIVFSRKRISNFLYMYAFAIVLLLAFSLIPSLFSNLIRKKRWDREVYYFTIPGKFLFLLIRWYITYVHLFSFVLAPCLAIVTWIFLIPVVKVTGLFLLGCLTFALFLFFYKFNKLYKRIKRDDLYDFAIKGPDFLKKSYYFKDIRYNKDGKGSFFLVKTGIDRWDIMTGDLQPYVKEGVITSFSRFVREEKGIFVMRHKSQEYYVFIKGAILRINRKIKI